MIINTVIQLKQKSQSAMYQIEWMKSNVIVDYDAQNVEKRLRELQENFYVTL